MSVSFIEAHPSDVELLISMMRQLREDDPCGAAFDEAAARAALPAMWAGRAPGKVWLIADEGRPVGYVAMTLSYSLEFGGHAAFIDELFVSRSYRRRGIGEMACRMVENEARSRGVRVLLLEVAESNAAARSLHRRMGFADRHYRAMSKKLN
jgi:ribosomal protein S18 acetylase RimI-like enzyme